MPSASIRFCGFDRNEKGKYGDKKDNKHQHQFKKKCYDQWQDKPTELDM